MEKGKYFVIEGPEKAGKTTQVQKLVGEMALAGYEARSDLREPGATPMGEAIRGILLDNEIPRDPLTNLYLFNAARAEILPLIKQEVEEGKIVVSDRNHLSSFAYQVIAEGVDEEIYRDNTKRLAEIVEPNLTFILMISVAEQSRRMEEDETPDYFESKGPEFHSMVINGYRQAPGTNYMLDGEAPANEVHAIILEAVEPFLGTDQLDLSVHSEIHAKLRAHDLATREKYKETT